MHIESVCQNPDGTFSAVIDFRNERDFKEFWKSIGQNPPSSGTCILLENFEILGRRWREGCCHDIDLGGLNPVPVTDDPLVTSKVDLEGQSLL